MENQVKEGQEAQKLSNEELKNIAAQWKSEAEGWRRKANEAAGQVNRISLLIECLKLQCSYIEFKEKLFPPEGISLMVTELLQMLYPAKEENEDKEAPVIPLMETEEVN